MASRRSPAAFYGRLSISAVSRGDTYLSETHCKLRRSAAVGRADSLSPSLGSAKRDRLFFSTSYGERQSPFGELHGVEVSHVPTAALLRSLQWVSRYRSRSAEPAASTICLANSQIKLNGLYVIIMYVLLCTN